MVEQFILAISIFANLIVGLIVYSQNRRSLTNKLFGLLALSLSGWALVSYFSVSISANQLFLMRLTMCLVVAMNTTFYYLTQVFPRPHIVLTRRQTAYGIFSFVTMIVAMSPFLFVSFTVSANGSVSPNPGPGMLLFLFHAVISAIGGPVAMIRRYRSSRGLERAQLRFMTVGMVLMFTSLPITNLVLPLVLGKSNLIELSPLYTAVFSGLIGYAIARHRFLNIRAAVARTLAYVYLLATLAGLYATAFFGSANLFFSESQTSLLQGIINTILAIVLAFTFQPLRRFFEQATDRILYRDRYDSQEVLNNFSKILVTELDLDKILHHSLKSLSSDLHIQYAQLAVFDDERIYRIEHVGKLPERLMVGPEMRKLDRTLLVSDELDSTNRNKLLMDDHGIRVSLMLSTREQFVGYLLLGDKLSGEIYSRQDIELLEIVVKQLAVAILNAKAYIEIQEFNQTLQARVDHATSRIRVANRHLKELDKAKDEFISMASHQLRTPLTTIKGYLSMILDGDAGEITPTQREFVDFAFGASERMVNLISDLLNVSRLSAGRFLIQTKPTDIVAMIQDEVRQLMSHATAKKIQLVFTPPTRPIPPVELDENKTRQVVMNFIDNAIYYTQQGSVTLTLEQVGESVRLEVKDTGIGVPEEARKKLFSKFFRAENAQTVRPDGTGLGLYLARRVISDQGGTIIFDSVEGKGSTFGFELPLKAIPQPNEKG